MVVIVEANNRITSHFHSLVKLGPDQTSKSQFEALKQQFQNDGIWPKVQANMVGLIVDGASTNTGMYFENGFLEPMLCTK